MVFRTIGIHVITSTFFYVFLRFFKLVFTFFAVSRTFSRTMTVKTNKVGHLSHQLYS